MGGQVASRWPMVGRDESLDAVTALRSRAGIGGVVLHGPAGVGKSALASAFAARADAAGDVVLRLVASPAAAGVPFGALYGLGDLLPAGDVVSDRAALWAEAARTLRRLGDDHDRPPLLVVDDIPLLDPGSAALIAHLVRTAAVWLVGTARNAMALAPELDGLLVEGTLLRRAVDPLPDDALRRAAEVALDGPLHADAAATLAAASRGVPLHARELVEVNVAEGRLAPSAHGWVFTQAPAAPPGLVELVTSRFGTLGDDEYAVFETLAITEPLPMPVAVRLCDVEVLAALEAAELVTVVEEGHGLSVRLGHPLYGEVARARSGPLQLRRAAARAVAAIDALPAIPPDLALRAACLRLDHDLPMTAGAAVSAARRALSLVDPHLAERLLAAVGDGFDASFVRGTALSAQGRHDEADQVLQGAFSAAVDDAQRARVISRRGNNLGSGAGHFSAAIAVLEAGLEQVADPRWRSFLAADLAYARLWAGSVAPVGTSAHAGPKPAEVRANECLIGAVVAAMRGELATAEAYVMEGLPLAPALRDDVPTARELLTLSRFLTLAFGGDRAGADALVVAELERSTTQGAAGPGTWIAVRSMQHLHDGATAAAIEDAVAAEALLASVDVSGLRPVVQAIRAVALAQRGDAAASLAASGTIDPIWRDETKVGMHLAAAEAWRMVAAGETRAAVALLVSAGQACLDAHHVAFGALAAYDAVRLGHPGPALPVLRVASERLEGPLAVTLLEHASRLHAGDAPGLLALAPALGPLGFRLAGAEAASQAAALFEQTGRPAEAERSRFVAAGLVQPLGGARSPALGRPRGLTPREREVAVLAASRHRSRDIATTLGISARTVDNHLAAVYRKLGVVNRRALTAALGLEDGGSGTPDGSRPSGQPV